MPRLRTSFLLRRTARVTGLPPGSRFVVLVGATSFFLWMFLAVAPLETLADTGALRRTDGTDATLQAYEFAAQWRHGMAGNAPLYMPGFFLLAVSAWLWAGADVSARPIPRLLIEGAVALIIGLSVAWIVSRTIADAIVPDFERAAGFRLPFHGQSPRDAPSVTGSAPLRPGRRLWSRADGLWPGFRSGRCS